MLFGNLLANTGLAVANYAKGTVTPYVISIIADDLTQRARIRNVVRGGDGRKRGGAVRTGLSGAGAAENSS